jgi:hypothetical protein
VTTTDDYPEKPKRGESNTQWRITGAVVLIGVGLFFLLQQYGLVSTNFAWWSLFIIVPGLGILVSGIMAYRRAGYLTNSIRGQISGGTMMTLVGAIFLFHLDWGKVWPVFIIVPGVFMLLGVNRESDA